eukprot:scaffold3767_cov116-Skeletonema_menzelii.AAC.14
MEHLPLPNPPRGGTMVAICDDDVRRAMANEHRLSNAPMSVSAGSKHVGINIVIHTNDQPSIGR